MRLRLVSVSLLLFLSIGSVAFASTVSYAFFGPEQPVPNTGPSDFKGNPCDPNVAGCIFNASLPKEFIPFSAILTGDPTGTQWTLTIQTNSPNAYIDAQNHGGTPIPAIFGDGLIQWGTDQNGEPINWGVAIGSSQPDPNTTLPSQITTAGALYKVNFNSGQNTVKYTYDSAIGSQPEMYLVAGAGNGPYVPGQTGGPFGLNLSGSRVNVPVWINPNDMTAISTSGNSLNIQQQLCGSTVHTAPGVFSTPDAGDPNCGAGTLYSLYTITDTFTAPVGFLSSGVFSFEFSSFICDNGLIIGSQTAVPEPRSITFVLIGAMLMACRVRRWRKSPSISQ